MICPLQEVIAAYFMFIEREVNLRYIFITLIIIIGFNVPIDTLQVFWRQYTYNSSVLPNHDLVCLANEFLNLNIKWLNLLNSLFKKRHIIVITDVIEMHTD